MFFRLFARFSNSVFRSSQLPPYSNSNSYSRSTSTPTSSSSLHLAFSFTLTPLLYFTLLYFTLLCFAVFSSRRLTRAVEEPLPVYSHAPVPTIGLGTGQGLVGRGKTGKEHPVQTHIVEVLNPLHGDLEPCIPLGDESWVEADSGLVLELSPIDLKALDKIPRELYGKQLRYQQSLQLKAAEDVIRRILYIWSPESGLIGQNNQKNTESLSEIENQDETFVKTNLMFGNGDERSGERSLSMILEEPSSQLRVIMEEHNNQNVLSSDSLQVEVDGEGQKDGEALNKLPVRAILTYCEYVTDVLPVVIKCFEKSDAKEIAEGIEKSSYDMLSHNDGVTSLPSLFVHDSVSTDSIDLPKENKDTVYSGDKMYSDRIPSYGIFEIPLEMDEDLKDIYMNMMVLLPPPKVSTYVRMLGTTIFCAIIYLYWLSVVLFFIFYVILLVRVK